MPRLYITLTEDQQAATQEDIPMLVARFTSTPDLDCKVNWSGYMGTSWKTLREAFQDLDGYGNSYVDIYESEDDVPDDVVEDWCERAFVRFDPRCQLYRAWHHDGLSCWELESQTDSGAVIEARLKFENHEIEWAGFGYSTIGNVKLVSKVVISSESPCALWVFECEGINIEV